MKNVSFLIPYRAVNEARQTSLQWMQRYYRTYFPGAELCLGSCKTELFSRAQAINDAAGKATRDIFVIVDVDLIYDPSLIIESVERLRRCAWVIPYSRVNNLSKESTERLYGMTASWPLEGDIIISKVRKGRAGGICVIPRKHFETVGGFDPRFIGWGGEDDAFSLSVNTLCGKHERMPCDIYHLWHPSQKKNPNSNHNLLLLKRYQQAQGDPGAMKSLISEKYTG